MLEGDEEVEKRAEQYLARRFWINLEWVGADLVPLDWWSHEAEVDLGEENKRGSLGWQHALGRLVAVLEQ
jgi:hypothetical protein